MKAFTTMDFAGYLAAIWTINGALQIPEDDKDLHQRLADSFNGVLDSIQEHGLKPRFHIIPNPLHGGSETIYSVFSHLIQLCWARRESPSEGYLILTMPKEDAESVLTGMSPAIRSIFEDIARDALNVPRLN